MFGRLGVKQIADIKKPLSSEERHVEVLGGSDKVFEGRTTAFFQENFTVLGSLED